MTFLYRHLVTQMHGQVMAWNAASSTILELLSPTVSLYSSLMSTNASFVAMINLSLFLFIFHFLIYKVHKNHPGKEFKMQIFILIQSFEQAH